MNADISILFQKPEINKQAILTIEPLAPLSIVNTLPGSYYKSQDAPTKSNLCGVFENILGWHIGKKDRSAIIKKIKDVYKKEYEISDYNALVSPVGYTSLLSHLFTVELFFTPVIKMRYDDMWTQQLKDRDVRHLKGTPNLSYHLIKEKRALPKDEKGKTIDKDYTTFFKENIESFPMFYTSPTSREFIVVKGEYQFRINISSLLLDALKVQIKENNIAYLGTNEGWINLSINEI